MEVLINRAATQFLLQVDAFSVRMESDNLFFFFGNHHFQGPKLGFAPFHRPQNLTCRTAGRTQIQHESKEPQSST